MSSCTRLDKKVSGMDKDLDAALFNVTDETLKQIFKDAGVKVIYDFLEKNSRLKYEEIVEKPEVFSAGLESLLGSAAPVIEKQIIRNLHRKLQLEYVEKEESGFSACMKELRQRIHSSQQKTRDPSGKKEAKIGKSIKVSSRNSSSSTITLDGSKRNTTEGNVSIYESTLKNMQIGVDIWHLENVADLGSLRLIFSNSATERITGVLRKDVVGRTIREAFPEGLKGRIPKICSEIVQRGMTNNLEEVRYEDSQGSESVFSVKAFPLPNNCVGLTYEKITERKKFEEKYRNVSKRLESLMKSSAMMLRTVDMRERLKTIAEAVREQGWGRVVISLRDENLNTIDVVAAGLTQQEEDYLKGHQAPGHVWRKRLSSMFERYRLGEFYYLPWSDPVVQEQFKYALTSKVPREETVDWNPDDLLFVPLRLPTGQVVGIMSIDDPKDGRRPTKESLAPLELFAHQAAVAIENAKLLQQVKEYAQNLEEKVEERTKDLRKSEEKLRGIFEVSRDAVALTDLDGTMVDCNPATSRMHGRSSKSELIGKNGLELVAPKDRQRAMGNMRKTLEQGETENIEYMLLTKDGREFPAEVSASVIRDTQGNPQFFVTVTRDITERKLLEQQLFKSERLAAIGELAAMVGHDLRNPLTGIAGAIYYLRSKYGMEMDANGREMLNIVERDIEYSNKIINDLLEYSKEIRLELEESTPKAIMDEVLSVVHIPDNIQVLDLTKNRPRIMVDTDKLKRTFVNIIKNAIDAMPRGGTLTVKSRRLNSNLEIVFVDTGKGMTRSMLSKIFTPLFTTKARGMGFGLAVCKRFVEAHGGRISAESALRKGTKFTVTIPIRPKMEGGGKFWVNVPESLSSMMMKA